MKITNYFSRIAIIGVSIAAISGVFLLNSCKKDSTTTGSLGTMTLTSGGSTSSLSVKTLVTSINDSIGAKLYSTTGTGDLLTTTLSLNVTCVSLEKKTYPVKANLTSILVDKVVGYVEVIYIKSTLTGITTYSNNYSNASGSVTFTDITSTYVKGNYDVVLTSSSGSSVSLKGDFYSAIF